jgi:hypothetical protein
MASGRTPQTDRFSSAMVALDADTGAVRWSFQAVHHDLWDYDLAAQPVLVDFPTPAGPVPSADPAHQDGPDFRARPPHRKAADAGGGTAGACVEHSRRALVAGRSLSRPACRILPARPDGSRHVGHDALRPALLPDQIPPGALSGHLHAAALGYSIRTPGELGGIDWGSVSVDEGRGILVVNSNLMADYDRFITRARGDKERLFISGDPRRGKTPPRRGDGGHALWRALDGLPDAPGHSLPEAALRLSHGGGPEDAEDAVAAHAGQCRQQRAVRRGAASAAASWVRPISAARSSPRAA